MTTKGRSSPAKVLYKLDTKPYMEMVRETGELARKELAQYGDPRMPLLELRETVDKQMNGRSLSGWLLEDRESGW